MLQDAAGPRSTLQQCVDRGPLRAIQVRVLALSALVTLIEGIDLTLIPLLAPSIAASWSLQPAALGVIFSTGAFGLIFGGLGIGWLADRIGRRGALVAAMLLMTGSTLATARADDVATLLLCRLLAGVAFGGVIPAAVALVSEFLPERTRASAVALVILGQAVGALLAALLLGWPALAAQSWQTLVLYAGMACAVVTLLLVLLPESPRYLALRDPGGAKLQAVLNALRVDPARVVHAVEAPSMRLRLVELFAPGRATGTALLWATFIGVGWPLSFFTNWLTRIYTEAGHAAATGVRAMAFYSAGAIAGGLLLPLLSRRWHHDRVLLGTLVSAFLLTVALGALLAAAPAVLHLGASLLCGVFVSGAFFLLYPPAVRFYPTDVRATGIGAAVAFGRIGNTVSPTVAGLMLGAGLAPRTVFWAMALPLLLSCTALWLFHRLTVARASPAAG